MATWFDDFEGDQTVYRLEVGWIAKHGHHQGRLHGRRHLNDDSMYDVITYYGIMTLIEVLAERL